MLRSTRVSRTEPSTEPVSVSELRDKCRITSKVHDEQLRAFLTGARKCIEDTHLWRALITQTCIDRFDAFDSDGMELRCSPAQSITSVGYVDTDGDDQTLADTVYELGQIHGMGIMRLKYGQVYPSTRSHPDVITLTYVAGYGDDASDVPEPIRQAILMHALWQHTEREGMNFPGSAIDHLLMPFASMRVL